MMIGIGTILEIALEIYKNKGKISLVFNPKYLNYDLNRLTEIYSEEQLVENKIPYVELINWIEKPKLGLTIRMNRQKFNLKNDNLLALKSVQTQAIEEFKKNGKFSYNSDTVTLKGISFSAENVEIKLQKSKYSDQIQSHLILDWENKKFKPSGNLNLRGYLKGKFGNKLPKLGTNLLSNSIGISCVIYFRKEGDFRPYLPFRNKSYISKKRNEPAIFEGIFHCSSSGVLEWKDDLVNADGIKKEMLREIKEEIGLDESDIYKLNILALTRELLRAGKPQIFFIGFTDLSESELIKKRQEAIKLATQNSDKIEIRDKHIDTLDKNLLSLEAIGNLYYSEKYLEKYGREQSAERQ